MNVIVLNNHEDFIDYLDNDFLQVEETHEEYGLRTIDLEYTIEDVETAKKLFKTGNKILIMGSPVIDDCLYVINDTVKEDYFKDNKVTLTAEEVLTELNYAPPITHVEITTNNGFNIGTTNGEAWVEVNFNALNYWFGSYYNIGIVQKCVSQTLNRISVTGTMNLMSLLRYIEEETGNVFVTRYEKDFRTNVVHRYLDFLNPTSTRRDWEFNIEYDFVEEEVIDLDPYDDTGVDIEDQDDVVIFPPFTPEANLDPSNTVFRITDGREVLNTNGVPYDETDDEQTPLEWSAEDVGLTDEEEHVSITLSYKEYDGDYYFGVEIKEKSFPVLPVSPGEEYENYGEYSGETNRGFVSVSDDPERISSVVPDTCYFEILNTETNRIVFQTKVHPGYGDVHEDVLDLTYNTENITYEIDESDTYTAIAPILSIKQGSDTTNDLTRTDLGKIINAWRNLSITKGTTIPMIVEKATLTKAEKDALGTFSVGSNYYKRPYHPQDNIDTGTPANSTYEYLRATAYWSAPFTKRSKELFVKNDTVTQSQYNSINWRPDNRDERSNYNFPKTGTVETSDEDIYAIYNDVAMKLKDKRDPQIELQVDVANYQNGLLNTYRIGDKVYVKVPGYGELVTANVTKTHKNPYDIGENTLELGTFNLNKKVAQTETSLLASNINLKYPNKTNLDAQLIDDLDNGLNNKLVSFSLYRLDENQTRKYSKTYNKKTKTIGGKSGVARLPISLTPGNWEVDINFGGDLLYASTNFTVDINVSGTIQKKVTTTAKTTTATKKTTTTTTNTAKPVTATAKKTIVKQTADYRIETRNYFYNKYGRSPDGKYVCAIGLPSRQSELKRYGYKYLKTVFVNKCPVCGKNKLYWDWNFGTYSRGRREDGSKEGRIFCEHCDSDFSVVYGERQTSGKPKLTLYQKQKWSSKTEANQLKAGNLLYKTETIKIPIKKVTSKKQRQIPSYVSKYVRNAGLRLAGDSQGWAAAKKIAAYMSKIHYSSYYNFNRSPDAVLKTKRGNCCDQARLFLYLCAGAGCLEFLTLKYVYVCCGPQGGHVFTKVINNRDGGSVYVDPCKTAGPWGHYVTGWGRPPGRQTTFPNRPF